MAQAPERRDRDERTHRDDRDYLDESATDVTLPHTDQGAEAQRRDWGDPADAARPGADGTTERIRRDE